MKRTFHPNAPRKLVSVLRKAGWNERELSRRLGVNILYVSQLLKRGIEPTDRTLNGQEIRVRLFLPRHKRKPRVEKPPLPEWLKKVKKKIAYMRSETRKAIERR